jgi:hypothetical protein
MEFEALEQLVLADRSQWKTILAKISINNSSLYNFLHLIHTNKNGCNSAEIEKIISQRDEPETQLRHRHFMDVFDKLPEGSRSELLSDLTSHMSLSLYDTKQDTSSSVATVGFMPVLLDQSVATFETMFNNSSRSGFDSTVMSNPYMCELAFEWAAANAGKMDRYVLDRFMDCVKVADSPHLVGMLAKQLTRPDTEYPKTFGSAAFHKNLLTLNQLEELRKLVPNVIDNSDYVRAMLDRLISPTADVDKDAARFEASLAPVVEFVGKLSHVFNSIKSVVFYNLLLAQVRQGKFDESTLNKYLAIPKYTAYYNSKFTDAQSSRGQSIPHVGSLDRLPSLVAPSYDDENKLIGHFLTQIFIKRPTYEKSFETMISESWLKDIFARAKLLYGPPADLEKHKSLFTYTSTYDALKKETRIAVAPFSAPKYWPGSAKVSLTVEVKNVPKLIVKLFEINTLRYYRDNLDEIPSDISLEGLVASEEKQYEYSEADHVSVLREYSFPSLDGRCGVFVVEFVGAGKSERAVIYKGRLNIVQRPTIAGHVFTVMNEKYEKVVPAHLWMAGQLYHTDEDGEITLPFASHNQSRSVVVYGGDGTESSPFAELYNFHHQTESYAFDAQFHVERESLVPFNKSSVLIKPKLLMNGSIVTPSSLLTDCFLTISTTDIDGVSSSKDVPIKFADDADFIFEFQVPDRLTSLSFALRAQIKKMSDHSKVNFNASKSYNLNGIDSTDNIEQVFLRRTAEQGYSLHLLGKTGDAIPRREISIQINSHFFADQTIYRTLTTDDKGVVPLGPLTDFTRLTCNGVDFPLGAAYTSNLLASSVLHLKTGQALQVALNEFELDPSATLKHHHASLVSLCPEHGNVVLADFFHLLKFEKGLLTIPRGLMAGTYRLTLKRTHRVIMIYVQQALQSHSNFLFGSEHILEKSPFSTPLQISAVSDTAEAIKVELVNSTDTTRVHLFVAEYVPEYDVRDLLRACAQPAIARFGLSPPKEAQYVSRELSEEQRYILDRRYAPARQGNTLTPPSLLLNPWAVDTTRTSREDAGGGGSYGSGAPESVYAASMAAGGGFGGRSVSTNNDRNFDFKFYPCKTQYNLKPDENGVVTVKRSAVGGTPNAPLLVRVMAIDSAEMVFREHTAKAAAAGAEPAIAVKDLRLKPSRALNPAEHFAEQKGITLLQVNQKFTVDDLSTSKIEILDSMAKVYGFFTTVSGNDMLKDWNWLLRWDSMTIAEKEDKYHEFASHELHVFIYFKDRKFFDTRIAPYLKNKLQKTFIDEWLLIQDPAFFAKYAAPGLFSTLNAAEKALLAHRLAAKDGDALAKSLNDLSEAIAFSKSDRNKFNHLFKTVLGSSSLNTESDGYVPEVESDDQALEEEILAPVMPAPPPATMSFASFAPAPMMAMSMGPPPMASRSMAAPIAKLSMREEECEMDMDEAPRRKEMASKKSKKRAAAPEKMLEKRSRAAPQQLFQAPEKTKKYAESQYYKQADPKQSASLISMNAFWSDYALHRSSGKSAFLSKQFIHATGSFAEMVLAMAVLDLPLARPAQNHPTEFSESGMTLTALAPVIVFHKDVKGCPVEKRQVLVAQNFFDPLDRHTTLNGERVEKYIEEEFLNRKVYGCNYIITNISSSPQRVEVLLQLPVGAVPVLSGSLTKSVFLEVSSYTTQSGQFYFYFPRTGDYQTFPVHVSRDEKTIAWATMTLPEGKPLLHVVDQLHKHDVKSWNSYISQLAPNEQVYEYLQNEDIFTVDLGRIAWRMRDREFFTRATAILRSRSVFNRRLWAYVVSHQPLDKVAFTELLNSDQNALRNFVNINAQFECFPGLNTHAWAIRATQHYEFWPLINARAHKLGAERVILNDGFKAAYQTFLRDLAYRSALSKTDLLIACYYMLLQDRVEEGIKLFEQAQSAPLEAGACPETVSLQMDYLAAYLDFYNEQPKVARTICAKYLDHPVLRWRRMFVEMKKQLDEFDSGVRPEDITDPDDRNQRMGKAAHSEPTLDVETVPGKILLHHHSLTTATLSFYKMDIELLFSSADYKPHDLGKFAYVKPNASATVQLAAEGNETAVAVPPELENSNIMVEVTAGPHAKVVSYFSHSLLVKVSQSYGQIQVHDRKTGKSLSRVYVKVFSINKDGSNRFYKDGYTDLRGAFDYASLSTDELGNVSKFSILVMSPNNGTRILETSPPAH